MYDIVLLILGVLIVIIGIAAARSKKKKTPAVKEEQDRAHVLGKEGEELIVKELQKLSALGGNQKILRNIYVPRKDGETSEVDIVFLTQKGIFVVESKNYSGWVFGSEEDLKWTIMYPDKTTYQFYNPVKQNRTHIDVLSNYLAYDIPFYSLIIFSEKTELKKIAVNLPMVAVMKCNYLVAVMKRVWNQSDDVLNSQQVEYIYQKLKPLADVDEAVKKRHIDAIKQKY